MNVIGQSRSILEAQEKAKKVVAGKTPVLLLGENGTGKEFFARMIHELSPRRGSPFVAINLAVVPKDRQESELFGYKLGVSAGRISQIVGSFEKASRGTVFLDGIIEMDIGLQAKILTVLEGEGSTSNRGRSSATMDMRVIAATNSDLTEAVVQKKFLANLYYRLSVFPVVIPPLRERREDIFLFAEHFLAIYSRELNKEGLKLSPEVIETMTRYPWPGNIDELRGCIERAATLCDGHTIRPSHIDLYYSTIKPAALAMEPTRSLQKATREAVRAVEVRMIESALRETGWNKSKAAEILQVSYKTLLTKIKEYGIEQ